MSVMLDRSQFQISVEHAPCTATELLPDWSAHDRFGVIVDEPLGALGASLLLQLAITEFYRVDDSRRSRVYPEIYAFHVGEMHGTLGWMDVFPPRKEVVVPDDPAAILDAINDRGITRLAVVDGPVVHQIQHYQEPAVALDRIVQAFAYSPTGCVAGGDLEIVALDERLVKSVDVTLHPDTTAAVQQEIFSVLPAVPDEEVMVFPPETPFDDDGVPLLSDVAPETREAFSRKRARITTNGLPTETYRRVTPTEALGMLHKRS